MVFPRSMMLFEGMPGKVAETLDLIDEFSGPSVKLGSVKRARQVRISALD